MHDGCVGTLKTAIAPAAGTQVAVNGNTLRSFNGAAYAPAPEQCANALRRRKQRRMYTATRADARQTAQLSTTELSRLR